MDRSPAMAGRGRFVTRHATSDFVREHYEELFELGKGSYGRATLVRDRVTGQKRVCKIVDIASMTAFEVELAKREIRFLCELDHPRVVRLFEYAEDNEKQHFVLILEYLSGGDCLRLLKGGACPGEALVSRIISQTLSTLAYCHEHGVVHRDIKLENLILSAVPLRGQPDCRLIDFGFAARADPLPRDILGTPTYMAPDVRRGEGYTPASEVWSVGVCALELLAGKTPFGKPGDYAGSTAPILERLSQYKDFSELSSLLQSSSSWASRSAESKDFVRRMLDGNRSQRPSISEALNHPWLRQHQNQPDGLGEKLLGGLATFVDASPAAQSCLCAIAARSDVGEKEMRQVGKAFLAIDANCDGQISGGELARAIGSAGRLQGQQVDVQRLFNAMNFDQAGTISFTKFMAASLSLSFASPEELFLAAFRALDGSRRGALFVPDIQHLLPDYVLQHLPRDRDVEAKEWVALLVAECRPTPRSTVPSHQVLQHLPRDRDVEARTSSGSDASSEEIAECRPTLRARTSAALPGRCVYAFNSSGVGVGGSIRQMGGRGVIPMVPSIACL